MWTKKKLAGKKQNIDAMWKVFMKDVDLEEPTSFLDNVSLGCTQRECQTSKDIVDNYRNMIESRFSAEAEEKIPYSEKLGANISSRSHDMEGHTKKCVERFCELTNKTTQQLYKVATPCIDGPPIQGRRNGICRRIVKGLLTNCCKMHVLGPHW